MGWRVVLFSDKSRFVLDSPRVAFESASAMAWVGVSLEVCTKLQTISRGLLTEDRYVTEIY